MAGLGEQRLDKVRQQSEALGNHAGVRRQTQQVFNDQTEALAAACVASPRRRRCSSGPSTATASTQDDRGWVHRSPTTGRREPTGRIMISGPSTNTVWFVC